MTNTSELLADTLRTAFRRLGGIPSLARSEGGAEKIIEIAVREFEALRPSPPSDVGSRSDMAMLAGKRSIPDIRGMSGSIGEARCLKLWFARNVTDDDRAWLLQAINEKMHREETAALRQSAPSPGEQKLGSSKPLGPLYDGTTMDNQQLHGTTRRNQPVVTAGETATTILSGTADIERAFRDACDEAGCAYDNEALLQAISDLKALRSPAPGNGAGMRELSERELEIAMRDLANKVKLDTIAACAKVAAGYPAKFGSEYEAAGLIRKGQNDAARDIAERISALAGDEWNATPATVAALPEKDRIQEAIGGLGMDDPVKFLQWADGSWRTYYAGFDLTDFAMRLLAALAQPEQAPGGGVERAAVIEECAGEIECADWSIPLKNIPEFDEYGKQIALRILEQAARQVRALVAQPEQESAPASVEKQDGVTHG